MEPQYPQLPFLTREMLKWGNTASLSLRVRSQSNTAGITVHIKGITRSGVIGIKHITVAEGTAQITTHKIDDFPIQLTANTGTESVAQGTVWVSVELVINSDISIGLVNGFVYEAKSLTWPFVGSPDMRPGYGLFTSKLSADPAAGAQVNLGIPLEVSWRVLRGTVTLVTDATVADRYLHIRFYNSEGEFIEAISSVAQAASLTRKYSFGLYGALLSAANDDDILIPIPSELILDGDGAITTTITGGVAGDNLGAMRVYVIQTYKTE